jgi:hypothetical protein
LLAASRRVYTGHSCPLCRKSTCIILYYPLPKDCNTAHCGWSKSYGSLKFCHTRYVLATGVGRRVCCMSSTAKRIQEIRNAGIMKEGNLLHIFKDQDVSEPVGYELRMAWSEICTSTGSFTQHKKIISITYLPVSFFFFLFLLFLFNLLKHKYARVVYTSYQLVLH